MSIKTTEQLKCVLPLHYCRKSLLMSACSFLLTFIPGIQVSANDFSRELKDGLTVIKPPATKTVLFDIVRGTVTDNQGQPIPGVSITLKGSSVGTTTNEEGKFSLDVPAGGILIFSYVGFTSKEVAVDGLLYDNFEEFATQRCTGYPVLTPPNYPSNFTGGKMLLRLRYPISEASLNKENYETAVAVQGPDLYTTPIWWDK